jgi:hypothetical protein
LKVITVTRKGSAEPLHLTGAVFLDSRDIKLLLWPRQVSFSIRLLEVTPWNKARSRLDYEPPPSG